jgi:hypothetical protein
MSNMQAFRKRLSKTAEGSDKRQRHMVQLTHVNRAQILDAVSAINWFIWNEEANPAS